MGRRVAGSVACAVLLLGSAHAHAASLIVTTSADSGAGSLRQAIVDANGNGESDVIDFSADMVIAVQSPLPKLNLDTGCAQPPCTLQILSSYDVVVDGNALGSTDPDAFGLRITGPHVGLANLTFNGFPRGGVLVDGTDNVTVVSCNFGTSTAGTSTTASTVVHGSGILVRGGATAVVIIDNVISGIAVDGAILGAGVRIVGPDTNGVIMTQNIIGLARGGGIVTGSGAQPIYGVVIEAGAHGNTVGGPWTDGNTIANQRLAGIVIDGTGTSGNMVVGNRIGTDPTGMAQRANGHMASGAGAGVHIRNGASDNTVGEAGELGNVISGNVGCQVWLQDASNNHIFSNRVGSSAANPTAALSNSTATVANQNGICVTGASGANEIGAGGPVLANRIAYITAPSGGCPPDCGAGVLIDGASQNGVSSNFIGYRILGEETLFGAAPVDYGVLVIGGARRTTIGRDGPNVIANTTRAGIAVVGAATMRNLLMPNELINNGTAQSPGVEICLAADFTDCIAHGTSSDSLRGNGGIAPPVFDADVFWGPAGSGMALVTLTGTVSADGHIDLFRVPLPASTSGQGGLGEPIGGADPSGTTTFDIAFDFEQTTSHCVTAIFTDASGNSSEPALNVRVAFGTPDGLGADLCRPGVGGADGGMASDDGGPPGGDSTVEPAGDDAAVAGGDHALGDTVGGDIGKTASGGDADVASPRCSSGFERRGTRCIRQLSACNGVNVPWWIALGCVGPLWRRARRRPRRSAA